MVGEPRVCAVVVTHDRRALLEGCLKRLEAQDRPPEATVVVDNASGDGTGAMLAERFAGVEVLRLEENVGGGGGFARGVERALAAGADWIWVMDDDTWPEPGALAGLLAGAARAPTPPALLASVVRWKDERLHPMNVPWVRPRPACSWAAAAAAGLVPVRYTSFVSLLVSRDAAQRHGGPAAHYFLSGDDIEWTARMLRDGSGYLVPESVVRHWTPEPHAPVPSGERFYFHARNGLFLLRSGSLRGADRLRYGRWWAGTLRDYAREHRGDRARLALLGRALRDGLGANG